MKYKIIGICLGVLMVVSTGFAQQVGRGDSSRTGELEVINTNSETTANNTVASELVQELLLDDFEKAGEYLRKAGNEFGATTGRPRRCGWFDLVLSRYSLKVSGVKKIFLTKLDVLDGLDTIKVCIAYELDGKKIDYPPSTVEELAKVKPLYEEFPGWNGTTAGAKDFDSLPDNAKSYIKYLEKQLDTPIAYISTGYERNDVVER